MANKLRDEDLNLNIIVNGDKAKRELGDLEKSTRELTARNKELRAEKEKLKRAGKQESDDFKAVTKEITENNKVLKTNEARMTELRKEIGLTGLTVRQLRSEQDRLKRLMDNSTPGTEQWNVYSSELKNVNERIAAVTAEMNFNAKAQKNNEERISQLRKEMGVAALTVGELRIEQSRLKQAMEGTVPGTTEWKLYSAELSEVNSKIAEVNAEMNLNARAQQANEERISQLRKEMGVAALTVGELRIEQSRLKQAMEGTIPATSEWKAYSTELIEVDSKLAEVTAEMNLNARAQQANEERISQLRKEMGVAALTVGELRIEQSRLKKNLENVNPNTQEWKKYANELTEVDAKLSEVSAEMNFNAKSQKNNELRIQQLRHEMGVTALTANELRIEQSRLKQLMDNTRPNTEDWKRYKRELHEVDAQISTVRNGSERMHLSMGKMADGFNRYFSMISVWVASATGVIFGFKKASDVFAKFDDKVADVQKTTKMTKDEVLELNKEFEDIDTRTTWENLNTIAEEGGRIGIAKEELLGFTEAMDKANVALSDSFTGGTEEIAKTLGRLKFLFEDTKEMDVEKAYLAIGSAINELGADGVANEQNIANFATRIGSLSAALKPAAADALALGAAFEESGIEAEIASRAYSIVLNRATVETDKFAAVMGLSVKEVEDMINANPVDFFLKFSESLKGMNATDTARTLDNLKINADGANKVIGAAANNTDRFRQLLELSNKEFQKGTSIIDEFNIKNNTRQAQIEKSRKNLELVTRELGENLSPAVLISTNGFTYFVKTMTALIKVTKEYYPIIISSTAAIAAYTIALKLNTEEKRLALMTSKLGLAVERAWITVKALLTGQIKIATVAQRAWNVAVKANPIGAALSVIIAVGAAIWQYSKYVNQATGAKKLLNKIETEANKNIVEQKTNVELLLAAAKNEKRTLAERKNALEELNKISPEYFGNLTLEKINSQEATKATKAYTEALLEQARVQAAKEKLVELEKERIDAIQSGSNYQSKWYQTAWNVVKSFGNAASFSYNQAITGAKNATAADAEYMKQKEALIGIIDKGGKPANETPVGTRKTIDDVVYEWDGKEWKVVRNIGGGGGKTISDEELKKRADAVEAANAKEIAAINKRHLEGLTSEDQYNDELLNQELKFLADKMAIYKKGSKEYEEALMQSLEKQVQAEKRVKDLLVAAEKELADAKIENLQEGIDKEIAAENQRWTNEKTTLRKRLVDKQQLSADEIALNNTINQLIEQQEAVHQEKIRRLKEGKNLADFENNVTSATPVDPNFATPAQQQAFFDARIALVEAQYKKEKALAGKNQAALQAAERNYNAKMYQIKSDQIDAEFALTEKRIGAAQNYVSMLASVVDEESALGKALFLFNQGLAVAEVWINIAKANAKAIAASPLTIGQPWVSANTIQGGIQTGIILAQTIAKFSKKGKKDGGYTGSAASDDQPMGVYHANEWFANAKAVRNPEVKQFLDIFDYYQRTGQISRLNTKMILASLPVQQMYTGGYTSTSTASNPQPGTTEPQPANSIDLRILSDLATEIRELRKWRPPVDLQTFESKWDQYNDIKQKRNL